MSTEYELKFRAAGEQLGAIRRAYPGGERIEMETIYYDTPQRALSARKWTLRRRTENGRQVCALKTPTGACNLRGEWEVECADIQAAIGRLAELSGNTELAVLTAEGVEATCGARFTRQAVTISLGESSAELALDSGVLLGGGKELPLYEVEVELKTGNREDIETFASALAEQFALVPETRSKHHRAMALAKEG